MCTCPGNQARDRSEESGEKKNKQSAEYKSKNKESVAQQNRNYDKENADIRAQKAAKRREEKFNATTEKQRYDRDNLIRRKKC